MAQSVITGGIPRIIRLNIFALNTGTPLFRRFDILMAMVNGAHTKEEISIGSISCAAVVLVGTGMRVNWGTLLLRSKDLFHLARWQCWVK